MPRSSRCRAARFALLLVPALATPVVAAAGPNLVGNPDFASGISGWSLVLGPAPTWSGSDASANPLSGSIRLVNDSQTPNVTGVSNDACVPVTAGGKYVYGATVWVQPQVAGDQANPQILFFSDAGCTNPVSGRNGPESPAPGWRQLAEAITVPAGVQRARVRLLTRRATAHPTPFVTFADDVFLREGGCAPSATTLCLAGSRFAVSATWATTTGTAGSGTAVRFSADSGSFWFFSPSNLELDVKVLDACSFNNRFWVFAAGLTDVEVMLTVTDTERSVAKTYRNPPGTTFVTITDTAAFSTCP